MVDKTESDDQSWANGPPHGHHWGSTLLRLLLTVIAAFGGGILATVVYEQVVYVPTKRRQKAANIRPSVLSAMPEPPLPVEATAIDPFAQAIDAARVELGPKALVDVRARVHSDLVFLTGEADSRRTVARITEYVGRIAGVKAIDTRGIVIVNRMHTLRPGETLSKLAKKYYGRSSEWRRIVKANPQLNPNSIAPGTELMIPAFDK